MRSTVVLDLRLRLRTDSWGKNSHDDQELEIRAGRRKLTSVFQTAVPPEQHDLYPPSTVSLPFCLRSVDGMQNENGPIDYQSGRKEQKQRKRWQIEGEREAIRRVTDILRPQYQQQENDPDDVHGNPKRQ